VLRAAGRQRNLRIPAEQIAAAQIIAAALRTEQLTARPLVAAAFGATVTLNGWPMRYQWAFTTTLTRSPVRVSLEPVG
jgi:hypothetical protein